jgi:hypothetical protein
MNFVVVATQQRYRVKKRCGEPIVFIFREKPVCKVFKEQFATRGGGGDIQGNYRATASVQASARDPGENQIRGASGGDRVGLI